MPGGQGKLPNFGAAVCLSLFCSPHERSDMRVLCNFPRMSLRSSGLRLLRPHPEEHRKAMRLEGWECASWFEARGVAALLPMTLFVTASGYSPSPSPHRDTPVRPSP